MEADANSHIVIAPKKKRGRPQGSKNKVKTNIDPSTNGENSKSPTAIGGPISSGSTSKRSNNANAASSSAVVPTVEWLSQNSSLSKIKPQQLVQSAPETALSRGTFEGNKMQVDDAMRSTEQRSHVDSVAMQMGSLTVMDDEKGDIDSTHDATTHTENFETDSRGDENNETLEQIALNRSISKIGESEEIIYGRRLSAPTPENVKDEHCTAGLYRTVKMLKKFDSKDGKFERIYKAHPSSFYIGRDVWPQKSPSPCLNCFSEIKGIPMRLCRDIDTRNGKIIEPYDWFCNPYCARRYAWRMKTNYGRLCVFIVYIATNILKLSVAECAGMAPPNRCHENLNGFLTDEEYKMASNPLNKITYTEIDQNIFVPSVLLFEMTQPIDESVKANSKSAGVVSSLTDIATTIDPISHKMVDTATHMET